ncbi:MAG: helix-turn-helix transcriptional regulator [Rubrivivax sp.]|nr:helix-turn-helix transcriptional regulator [Rubrivivax sp.]MDZ4053441.1 helix-turn-helix transcriptional regulator [Phenylobacterium sp.]
MGATTRNTVEYPIHLWIAENVTNRRQALGMTQQELADKIPTSRPYVAHLEAGRVNATVEILWRVARALATEPAALIEKPEKANVRFLGGDKIET